MMLNAKDLKALYPTLKSVHKRQEEDVSSRKYELLPTLVNYT